ncbi:MAG: PilZ domain-containing protein [Candidatus Omnitrophica bacterium]|nr:PilZ domain-containing protein [Candidatus Omnitrophota bacterium]
MIERRRYMRFNAPVGVEYRTLTHNPIFGKALARDLSREGIRFDAGQPLPVGTAIEISMNVPGDNLPVFATGKVAWADGIGTGVKLTKINPSDRVRVLEYVYKEWLKTTRERES